MKNKYFEINGIGCYRPVKPSLLSKLIARWDTLLLASVLFVFGFLMTSIALNHIAFVHPLTN